MQGWFEGSGGLPLIRLEAVTAISAGRDSDRSVLYVAMRESTVEVYAVDRDRFISELEAFYTTPAVDPAKPAIEPRKIGKLYRMPTVEEVRGHKGKWRWYSTEWENGVKDVMLKAPQTEIRWRTVQSEGWFLLMESWLDGDTIEPIPEAS